MVSIHNSYSKTEIHHKKTTTAAKTLNPTIKSTNSSTKLIETTITTITSTSFVSKKAKNTMSKSKEQHLRSYTNHQDLIRNDNLNFLDSNDVDRLVNVQRFSSSNFIERPEKLTKKVSDQEFKMWCSTHKYADVLLDVFPNMCSCEVTAMQKKEIIEALSSKFILVAETIFNELNQFLHLSVSTFQYSEETLGSHYQNLHAFYTRFDPQKLKVLDETLEKFSGNEHRMWKFLNKKYKSEIEKSGYKDTFPTTLHFNESRSPFQSATWKTRITELENKKIDIEKDIGSLEVKLKKKKRNISSY